MQISWFFLFLPNDSIWGVDGYFKPLGKAAQTHIILPPETTWMLNNYLYLEDNTTCVLKWGMEQKPQPKDIEPSVL